MTFFLDYSTAALILLLRIFQVVNCEPVTPTECPLDCICYPDYLNNLASWKWIDDGGLTKPDDSENENFNPYLEHNEVYDNPFLTWKKLRNSEPLMKTVTCIIRNDLPSTLSKTLLQIPLDTQVLSILQAPGSGNLTLTKENMDRFPSLVGLELQGVSKHEGDNGVNVFRLSANALINHDKLTYLNLDKVLIEQRNVENELQEDVYVKVRPISEKDEVRNELQPRLLYLGLTEKEEENKILPYNEYKQEKIQEANNQVPTIPKMNLEKFEKPKIAVAFTQLKNLAHLRISGCSMLDISWDMFYKLENLKFLLLDKNDLLFLPDFVFYSTTNLTALSLSGNRILNLHTVGLAGLLYLEKLDVTNNNITHLSELSLPPFPHLQLADFRYNPIETIFPNTFEVMNTTKTLYLGNPSTPLEFFANSFYGLTSLTRLEISNVRVGSLDRPMLSGMLQLTTLVMDGSIPKISYDAFNDVPNLQKLILKHCGLRKISMDGFYGLSSLLELDLSHNQLAFLPPGVFDEQISLRELYLHHNQLTTLPVNLFDRLPAKLIRLDSNPWHCSCDMMKWNPKVINQLKRYYIPQRNTSNCQFQYDKGSMCFDGPQAFEIKYVYEKRVSPICATPVKFMKKSIFQVQHKGLHHCSSSTKNTTNKVQKPEKLAKFIQPYSDIKRQQIVPNKPIKVKKPGQISINTIAPLTNTIPEISSARKSETKYTSTNDSLTLPSQNIVSAAISRNYSNNNNHTNTSNRFDKNLSQNLRQSREQQNAGNQYNLSDATARLKLKMANALSFSQRTKQSPQSSSWQTSRFNGTSKSQPSFGISKKSLKFAKLQKSLKTPTL